MINLYNMSDSASEDDAVGISPPTSKKRPSHGRMKDVMAKIRLQSHETGPNCNCKRRYFDEVSEEARHEIIKRMNEMKSNDEISNYLSGLVIINYSCSKT